MSAAAIVTIIGAGLLVAALAFYLIRVALLLRDVSFNVGTIVAGLRAIAMQTEPLGAVMNDLRSDLEATQKTLERLVAAKQAQRGVAPKAAATTGAKGGGQRGVSKRSARRPRSGGRSTS